MSTVYLAVTQHRCEIRHMGVKGMKWGVRKKYYKSVKAPKHGKAHRDGVSVEYDTDSLGRVTKTRLNFSETSDKKFDELSSKGVLGKTMYTIAYAHVREQRLTNHYDSLIKHFENKAISTKNKKKADQYNAYKDFNERQKKLEIERSRKMTFEDMNKEWDIIDSKHKGRHYKMKHPVISNYDIVSPTYNYKKDKKKGLL